jgi:signal peptidase
MASAREKDADWRDGASRKLIQRRRVGEPMSAGDDGPPRREREAESFLRRFRTAERGPLFVVREVMTSVLLVAGIGVLLFAISGVWPPMVAVESGSMDPHMQKGDLVFVTEPGRFAPDGAAGDTGIVPYADATDRGYQTFDSYGSVVVYQTPERSARGRPPVIHRAHFRVEEGENWYERANKNHIGDASNCQQLRHCPAPHDGFITKGDNNPTYDQANGISSPVTSEWVLGVARIRIPWLGWIRLIVSGAAAVVPTGSLTAGTAGGGAVAGIAGGAAVAR